MMHETMRKGSFCSGQTAFWSRVSINRAFHLSVGAQPLKRASHLACLFWAWWKCMKKMFLDNFAALSTVPNICQRACFYIKGAAVSLRELSDSRWRNQWAQMGSKSIISALSCPSEVASLKPGAKDSIQNKDFTLFLEVFHYFCCCYCYLVKMWIFFFVCLLVFCCLCGSGHFLVLLKGNAPCYQAQNNTCCSPLTQQTPLGSGMVPIWGWAVMAVPPPWN